MSPHPIIEFFIEPHKPIFIPKPYLRGMHLVGAVEGKSTKDKLEFFFTTGACEATGVNLDELLIRLVLGPDPENGVIQIRPGIVDDGTYSYEVTRVDLIEDESPQPVARN